MSQPANIEVQLGCFISVTVEFFPKFETLGGAVRLCISATVWGREGVVPMPCGASRNKEDYKPSEHSTQPAEKLSPLYRENISFHGMGITFPATEKNEQLVINSLEVKYTEWQQAPPPLGTGRSPPLLAYGYEWLCSQTEHKRHVSPHGAVSRHGVTVIRFKLSLVPFTDVRKFSTHEDDLLVQHS